MGEQSFLRRLVVIGGHEKEGVGASLVRRLSEVKGFLSRVCPGARKHGNATRRDLDRATHYLEVLLGGKGGGLARGTAGHDAADAGLDLAIHVGLEVGIVYLTVFEWSHQGCESSLESILVHLKYL